MPFQPEPHQILTIDGIEYRIAEHPSAPGVAYGQEGRAAVVYQLLSLQGDKAIKVFRPRFRTPALVSLAENIAPLAALPGLQVCRRTVLTSSRHSALLRENPDLIYAVLMPWVEGNTWQEVIIERRAITPEQALGLARVFLQSLVAMEEKGLAHCDLSGANLILGDVPASGDTPTLSLVDVEGVYAPGLPKPEVLPAGSPGYAHRTAPQGLWSPQADRFAGALLLAEMLGMCDEGVRKAAWSESYFNPRELQQESERCAQLEKALRAKFGDNTAQLFIRAWKSDVLAECATFGEWQVALPEKPLETAAAQPAVPTQAVTSGLSLLLQAARQLEAQGNRDGAVSVYRQALSLCPAGDGQAEEIRFMLERLEKKAVPAPVQPPALEKALPLPVRNNETDHLYDEGLAAYQKQEWKRAVELLEEVERRSPGYRWGEQTAQGLLRESQRQVRAAKPKTGGQGRLIAMIGGVLALLVVMVWLVSQGVQGQGPLAFLATRTPTMTPTLTLTPTATATSTATITLTAIFTPTKTFTTTPTKTRTPAAPPACSSIGQTWVSLVDGMTLVCVPVGEFLMGSGSSDTQAYDDEKPQHTVYLDAYWIDQTEVTNGMYAKCVADGGCSAPSDPSSYTRSSYYGNSAYADYPVIYVDWNDAKVYCEWAGRKLPSEAQWEKAARGTGGWIYPWGNSNPTSSLLNYNMNVGDTTAVGSYPAGESPYGALDMAGNVWEWVGDWYGENYYSSSPDSNPTGPASGDYRVLRGGSWNVDTWNVRAANRDDDGPDYWNLFFGFRCSSLP